MKAIINNQILDLNASRISILDLGLNRGYGVFDYFKIVDNEFRFFEDHLSRFFNSIQLSNIDNEFTKDQIKEKIIHLKALNRISKGYVRITLTGGDSDDFLNPSSKSNLIIVVGENSSPQKNDFDLGAKLISKFYQRSVPKIKSTNYFFAQMHLREMQNAKAVDVLYFTENITETSRANIFFIKDEQLYTPKSNILEGITRKKVLSFYPSTVICDISMDQISHFDEAFICSSTREIAPVIQIDKQIIGNGQVGELTKEVRKKFNALCNIPL